MPNNPNLLNNIYSALGGLASEEPSSLSTTLHIKKIEYKKYYSVPTGVDNISTTKPKPNYPLLLNLLVEIGKKEINLFDEAQKQDQHLDLNPLIDTFYVFNDKWNTSFTHVSKSTQESVKKGIQSLTKYLKTLPNIQTPSIISKDTDNLTPSSSDNKQPISTSLSADSLNTDFTPPSTLKSGNDSPEEESLLSTESGDSNNSLSDQKNEPVDPLKELAKKSLTQYSASTIAEYYDDAEEAILSYHKKTKRLFNVLGKFLGAILALSFGFIETGGTVLGTCTGLGAPIIVAIWIARTLGIISLYRNWNVFFNQTGDTFSQIATQGLIEWHDSQGIYHSLNRSEKAHLGVFCFIAITTGSVVGSISWFYASSSLVALLGSLATTGIAAAFPPFAIFLFICVGAAYTLRLIKGFSDFQKKGYDEIGRAYSLRDFLKKPFQDFEKSLKASGESSKTALWLGYIFCGLLVLAGIVGTLVAGFSGHKSVTEILLAHATSENKIASGLGYFLGPVCSSIGRFFFYMGDMLNFAGKATKKFVSLFYKVDNPDMGMRKIPFSEQVAIYADAILEWVYYFDFLQRASIPASLAGIGSGFSGVLNLAVGVGGSLYESNGSSISNYGIAKSLKSTPSETEEKNDEALYQLKKSYKMHLNSYKTYLNFYFKSQDRQSANTILNFTSINEARTYALENPDSFITKLYVKLLDENIIDTKEYQENKTYQFQTEYLRQKAYQILPFEVKPTQYIIQFASYAFDLDITPEKTLTSMNNINNFEQIKNDILKDPTGFYAKIYQKLSTAEANNPDIRKTWDEAREVFEFKLAYKAYQKNSFFKLDNINSISTIRQAALSNPNSDVTKIYVKLLEQNKISKPQDEKNNKVSQFQTEYLIRKAHRFFPEPKCLRSTMNQTLATLDELTLNQYVSKNRRTLSAAIGRRLQIQPS